jgi:signal transduction histidine kinase
VSVADSGIGVAPSEQAAIFEAFRQGSNRSDETLNGVGLGPTSQRLAARLGGDVRTSRSRA